MYMAPIKKVNLPFRLQVAQWPKLLDSGEVYVLIRLSQSVKKDKSSFFDVG